MQVRNNLLTAGLYEIKDPQPIYSPGLVIFRQMLVHNLAEMIRLAGGASRLRPHCKTHKTREIIQMEIEAGITRHKCATIAEAEMLADVGAEDVLLAYQLVGPNVHRLIQLLDKFPKTKFACLVDSPLAVDHLSACLEKSTTRRSVDVLLDLDSGMNRTGIELDSRAIELYESILAADQVTVGGLHWYDGHHRQPDRNERTGAVQADWKRLERFRDQLLLNGFPVPRIVAGGTGSFPILAEMGEPGLELSPGTTIYHDATMQELFPELSFQPALGILTRVISCTRTGFLTLDVGHKACAADPPAGQRLAFPKLPDAIEVLHSEEHLVIKSASADKFQLGDHLIAIPRHACPTSALFEFADVIDDGVATDRWQIAARNRQLTV
jgi:D-serine deaminase-like pyridoxal phosphate-dependent protein